MLVSICIPTVEGPHRLERCLAHLFKDDSLSRYQTEVIVVDDGSSQSCLETNRYFCNKFNVKFLEQGYRSGVPKAWNRLVQESTGKYILLLNDDIEVMTHWLDVLIYTLENNDWLGCVGFNAYEGSRPEMPPVPTYIESKLLYGSPASPLLSPRGYAFAFSRENYNLVNGFDERYFCFYEEIDFALSLLQLGKRSTILNYPILQHYHGETTRQLLDNPQQTMNESKSLFESKWNVKWEELRTKFNKNSITSVPEEVNEWNSNLYIWV